MNSEESWIPTSSTPSGRVVRIFARVALTLAAVWVTLEDDCLDTEMPTPGAPLTLARKVCSLYPSITSARSLTRMVPPVGKACTTVSLI